MATPGQNTPPTAEENADCVEWPAQCPVVPMIIVDHQQPPRTSSRRIMDPQQSLFAPEWPVMANHFLERGSFGIDEQLKAPSTSPRHQHQHSHGSNLPDDCISPPASPRKLTKVASPSSPLREDWSPSMTPDIRAIDTSFEKGALTAEWTNASSGPLSPTWTTIVGTQRAESSSLSDPKAPHHTLYHIYHTKGRRHYTATTKRRTKKTCNLLRRKPRISEKERREAIEKGLISTTSADPNVALTEGWTYGSGLPGEDTNEEEEEGYLWHKPAGFGKRRKAASLEVVESTTPRDSKGKKVRNFRKGVKKESGTVLAQIPTTCLWNKYSILWYGDAPDEAGDVEQTENRWEMPGLSEKVEDGSNPTGKRKKKKRAKKPHDEDTRELTALTWTKPFSKKTRQYDFTIGTLQFRWKGTSTVQATGKFRGWARYNHLKLIVRIPLAEHPKNIEIDDAGFREVVLAKYTSSMKAWKCGELEMHDDVIAHVWKEFVLPQERLLASGRSGKEEGSGYGTFGYERRSPASVKESRFWDTLVATAMCMVVGEWQKRETVRQIIAAIIGAVTGAAGGF